MVFLFGFLSLAYSFSINDTLVLFTPLTPLSLLQQLSDFPNKLNINSNYQKELINSISKFEFLIMVDLTLQSSLYPLLDSVAIQLNTFYLSISPLSPKNYSPWRINLHNSYLEEAKAIGILINKLTLNNLALLSSSKTDDLLISDLINSNFLTSVNSFLKYDQSISQPFSDNLVGRMIKAKGIRNIIVVDQSHSLNFIQTSFINKNLAKDGTILIMSSKSIYSAFLEGSLIVVESGLEESTSADNYEFLAITKTLSKLISLVSFLNHSYIEKDTLNQVIRKAFPNNVACETYSLVNIHNNKKNIIGTLTSDLIIKDLVYYPGNTTKPTILPYTTIVLSIANGTNEIYNKYQFGGLAYCYQGARYAVMQSNLYSHIPGFQIELFPTDCGLYYYDPTWYTSCLQPNLHNLGVAYLAPFWFTAAYGTYETLESLGKTIPQISPFAQDESVNNSTQMPNFLKLSVTNSQYFSNGYIFLKSLGWKDIVVLTTNDSVSLIEYNDIVMYAAASGVRIVNPVDLRILPLSYSRDDFETYKNYFQAAKDTGCRIYLINCVNRGLIWEGLYDVGLRKGDVVYIGDSSTFDNLDATGLNLTKRQEIISYGFIHNYKEFNGVLGKALEEQMSKIFPSLPYLCITYDTVTVVKEAIILILSRGENYEDPKVLESVMRTNKITGCLGNIYFDSTSNSRGSTMFEMQQILQNETTKEMYRVNVVTIDKLSAKIISIITPLEWKSGNASVPSNYRQKSLCPFDSYLISESDKGKGLLYMFCGVFFVIALITARISYKTWKYDKKILTEKKIITFADMVFLSYFVFQFVQFLALGPDQNSFKYSLENFQILISLNIDLYFEITFQRFWIFFYAVLLFALAWTISTSVMIFGFEIRYKRFFFCYLIEFLKELILPILGHIGFMPIFSMLMNIYLCDYSIGNDLTDSYLNQDCTTFCYTGIHIIIVVLATLCIAFYLPSAIHCRPLWEKTQQSLNLCTSPLYLAFLSIFQVITVILNKTLKRYDQSSHGFTLSGLLLMFFVLTVYMKPYNYQRATIIQCTSLVLSSWGVLISAIFINFNNLNAWILIEFIGFFFILTIGGVFMLKHPAFIYSKKGKDISTLFLFQCCKNYEKYIRDNGTLNFTQRASIYRIDFKDKDNSVSK